MILMQALDYLFVSEKCTLQGLLGCVSLLWWLLKKFFQEINDFRVQLTALRLFKQIINYFLVEKVLALDSERQRANYQSVGNDSQWVNVTLLRVSFWVFCVHFHDLRSDVAHGTAFIINVFFVGFSSKAKVTQNPLILLLSMDDIFRLNVSVHDMVLVQVV